MSKLELKPKELLVERSRTDLHRNGISWTRGEMIEGQRSADHRKTSKIGIITNVQIYEHDEGKV